MTAALVIFYGLSIAFWVWVAWLAWSLFRQVYGLPDGVRTIIATLFAGLLLSWVLAWLIVRHLLREIDRLWDEIDHPSDRGASNV